MNKLSILVPIHNRRDVTLHFLEQLHSLQWGGVGLNVVIVDDGSTDGSAVAVRERFQDVTVLKGDGQLWWTGAINLGVRFLLERYTDAGDYVLIMNDDLELDPGFFAPLLGIANENAGALVSSITVHKSERRERILTAGFRRAGRYDDVRTLHVGEDPDRDELEEIIHCDMLTGASLLVPLQVFREIGLFDERNFPHNWGDLEFTLRAALKGYSCLVATRSKVYTEFNPNYPAVYYLTSSRRDYLKNLFDDRKHFYGFRAVRKKAFMHRPFFPGLILYLRSLLGLGKRTVLKLILPPSLLKRHLLAQARRRNSPDYVLHALQ